MPTPCSSGPAAEPFLDWSQGARLLIVNAAQAEALTGRDNPEQAAKVLTAWYSQVVVKLAEDGALWYTNGRAEPVRVPAEPVEEVIDGTGGGDAFTAGFLPHAARRQAPGRGPGGGVPPRRPRDRPPGRPPDPLTADPAFPYGPGGR